MYPNIKISQLSEIKFSDLFEHVDIQDTFKYGHIWNLLKKNETLTQFFVATLAHNLKEYIAESEKEVKKKDDTIQKLEISFVIDYLCHDLETWWEISGLGKKGDKEHYALDFISINELMDLDVQFAKETSVRAKQLQTFKGMPSPTLMDVIRIIIEEATFHGSPSQRDSRMKDLQQRIKDIDEGKEKLIRSQEEFKGQN